MTEPRDFKTELAIDKYSLDEEVIGQPLRFAYWSEMYAEAVEYRDKKKLELERIHATFDADIRNEINKTGVKLTEKAIEQTIVSKPMYIAAQDAYMAAVKDAAVLGVAREAFAQRKSMLELTVKLYLASYFSDASVEFDKEAEEKRIAAMRRKIAEKGHGRT